MKRGIYLKDDLNGLFYYTSFLDYRLPSLAVRFTMSRLRKGGEDILVLDKDRRISSALNIRTLHELKYEAILKRQYRVWRFGMVESTPL